MSNTKIKFGIVIVVILGSLTWLAFVGVQEAKTYYFTVAELKQMGDRVSGKRLRVGGQVIPGTIVRNGRRADFKIQQGSEILSVAYIGSDPLPDTFRDNAEALVEGKVGSDGVFQAHKLQAKCASKYEAEGGYKKAEPGT
jgi:cytochrome c-type biogenesis protein CcmE